MSGFVSLNINNRQVNWTLDEVRAKLQGLSELKDKTEGWIRSDLSISPSNWITQLFWTLIAKRFECLRHYVYGVDLEVSKSLLSQLQPIIQGKNESDLTGLFTRAVNQFDKIAPKHAISTSEASVSKGAAVLGTSVLPPSQPAPLQSLKTLVHSFDSCWNPGTKKYERIVFDRERIMRLFVKHNERFKPSYDPKIDYGFLQKKDLPPGTIIYVRADLHGDLKSLLENLKTLQAQKLLDENFRCLPNVQLVFLGDYADRGTNTMQILEILATLRLENPDQVTLIRGNHEDLLINRTFCGQDPDFKSYLFEEDGYSSDKPRQALLNQFYETMPLTVYMGEANGQGERQYLQFTHGLFELYADPVEMLNAEQPLATMVVSKTRQLSGRVDSIQVDDKADHETQLREATDKNERKRIKQLLAAQKIKALWAADSTRYNNLECTIFNWGDMSSYPHSFTGDPGNRAWFLTPTDVKHYLRLCSPVHKVKFVLRGHQHEMQHHKHGDKVVVSTLPVGMDSEGYAYRFQGQLDTAYILTTSTKINSWTKQAYQRKSGETDVQVTAPVPLRSEEF